MNHIYFFYDNDKNLLYVGKTTALPKRMSAHFSNYSMKRSVWKKTIDKENIIIYQCPNSRDLAVYENYFIAKYKPKYNKTNPSEFSCMSDKPYLEPISYSLIKLKY